ncbi:MAG: hypothetical protein U9Q81_26140 [Pseudomonadota bacterium]|nr:hypothetical protein [Pseudomonadota bacterium]
MRTEPNRRRVSAAGVTFLAFAAIMLFGTAGAEVITAKDPETGLLSWTWREGGISIELVQRLPDQTRAFFLGRGFPGEAADLVGRSCVFQTIFRNDGERPVAYDLDDWAVLFRGSRLPLQTRKTWEKEWQAKGIDQAARIAFRWSLLPTTQGFEPGDYNWGMTSFGLSPGERFDLELVISVGGERVVGEIPALVCAADR